MDGPVALHRGRDQDPGDPSNKPRFSVNGGPVNGILKMQSGKGGGRSIRPPGGRSIAFREAEKTTFVFDRDEEHEGGYGSEDEGHHSKRISAGFPLRLESMSGDHPELASGVSVSSRAGSAALLTKKVWTHACWRVKMGKDSMAWALGHAGRLLHAAHGRTSSRRCSHCPLYHTDGTRTVCVGRIAHLA